MTGRLTRRGLILSAVSTAACQAKSVEPLTLFAAASLNDVLTVIAKAHTDLTGQSVRLSFAGSGEVARQIEAGAPADVVVLADGVWMDRLAASGRLAAGSRRDLLGNQLVVIAPRDGRSTEDAYGGLLAGSGRIAIGDPASVPAGRYARQILESLGLWPQIRDRIVTAADVRAVRTFVARGEVGHGIVYRSDTIGQTAVRVVYRPPATVQPRIVYPAALTRTAISGAADFLNALSREPSRSRFVAAGFDVL